MYLVTICSRGGGAERGREGFQGGKVPQGGEVGTRGARKVGRKGWVEGKEAQRPGWYRGLSQGSGGPPGMLGRAHRHGRAEKQVKQSAQC